MKKIVHASYRVENTKKVETIGKFVMFSFWLYCKVYGDYKKSIILEQ